MAESRNWQQVPLNNVPGLHVLTIIARRDDYIHPVGSGFIIAQNIGVTARHVFEEMFKMLLPEVEFLANGQFRRTSTDPFKPKFDIIATAFSPQHPNGVQFHVDVSQMSAFSDIVVFRLGLNAEHPNYVFTLPKLHTAPPKVDSLIEAFGYQYKEIDTSVEVELYSSRGIVRHIEWTARNQGMLSFPVFLTDAKLNPGMSGGPVYSQLGFICGIVCHSLGEALDNSNDEHHSYIASIYPLLGSSIELNVPGEPLNALYSVKQLCERGIINMEGHQFFQVKYAENGMVDAISKNPT